MERRLSFRGRTDFKVVTRDGTLSSHCRGIEVSPTGIVLDRGRRVERRDDRILIKLEISLPERVHKLTALARPVWSRGSQQALRFVRISDADRLTLAEHLDVLTLKGALAT
jgi:hypothetical protein